MKIQSILGLENAVALPLVWPGIFIGTKTYYSINSAFSIHGKKIIRLIKSNEQRLLAVFPDVYLA